MARDKVDITLNSSFVLSVVSMSDVWLINKNPLRIELITIEAIVVIGISY